MKASRVYMMEKKISLLPPMVIKSFIVLFEIIGVFTLLSWPNFKLDSMLSGLCYIKPSIGWKCLPSLPLVPS